MRPTTKRAIAAGTSLAIVMGVAGSIAQAQDTPPQTAAPALNGAPTPATTPHQNATPAQSETPIDGAGRYSFTRIDGGLLRLDSVSGRVTVCSQHAAGWACEAVPQERAALEKEIGRLQDEVAGLKAEIAALRAQAMSELSPPRPPAELTPAPDKPDKKDSLKDSAKSFLPSPDRIESARVAIEQAWQRLVEMIVGLKNDVMRKG